MKLTDIDQMVLSSKPSKGEAFLFNEDSIVSQGNIAFPLNKTAIWILKKIDGNSSVEDILDDALVTYPDVNEEILKRDIIDFIYSLHQFGFIENVNLPKPSGYFSPILSFRDEELSASRSGCGMCKESFVGI